MPSNRLFRLRLLAATILAMTAFAANSVFCRLALNPPVIDPVTFTAIRIVSGALVLLVIARGWRRHRKASSSGSWVSAAALFLYAIGFSFAYLRLEVGAGALILFGMVQATMILGGMLRGERPAARQWLGLVIAFAGLVFLVSPGLSAPPMTGAVMMAVAGIAWGLYSLRGAGTTDPVLTTGDNFLRAAPMALIILALQAFSLQWSGRGVILAVASGALASGLGYAVWYAVLRDLTSTRAAAVQLTVPVLAAGGGMIFLDELLSWRFVVAAALILGGVALALVEPLRRRKRAETEGRG